MTDTTGSGRAAGARLAVGAGGKAASAPGSGRTASRRKPKAPSRTATGLEAHAPQASAAKLSDDAVLERLRELARAKGGGVLTERDIAGAGLPSRAAMRRRFGSWSEALERAGLRPKPGSVRYSDEECFANMAMLWRHCRGAPRGVDADRPPSTVGTAAYLRRAGTWKRALAAFAQFTGHDTRRGPVGRLALPSIDGTDEAAPADAAWTSRAATRARAGGPRRPGRTTPLSLRFKVLQRDRFRCATCGNNPAADPDCVLQVDHVVPRAKGGGNELANLRSLCASCNLGRGDRVPG